MRARAEARWLAMSASCLWLVAGSAVGAEDRAAEEKLCFSIPRREFLERVSRLGVFRLEVPPRMKLSLDAQSDMERWIVSELVSTGLQVESPSAIEPIWQGVERRIRSRRGAAGSVEWTEEMYAALRLHGSHELRRRLRLDALLVPSIEVIPGPFHPRKPDQRAAALCLVSRVFDMDGTLLYRNDSCRLVIEKIDAEGIRMRASARMLGSALERRYLAAASLHVLRGVAAPDRMD